MVSYSAAKSPIVIKRLQKSDIKQVFGNSVEHVSADSSTNDLSSIFSIESACFIQGLLDSIESFCGAISDQVEPFENIYGVERHLVADPVYCFLLSALSRLTRRFSGVSKSANPTWLKKTTGEISVDQSDFLEALLKLACEMLDDIERLYEGVIDTVDQVAINGSVDDMPLLNESIDAIITSPPYLTRIDYAMSTMPEMSLIAGSSELKYLRHKTTGAPVITKINHVQSQTWGELCNQVLSNVEGHSTKAAKSYYWKNIVQYFADIEDSLTEIRRVMREGSSALIVVQSSYFKDVEIPLGEIYVEMGEILGLKSSIVRRETVRGHMAHVNTKSSKYVKSKTYYEDVVELQKI